MKPNDSPVPVKAVMWVLAVLSLALPAWLLATVLRFREADDSWTRVNRLYVASGHPGTDGRPLIRFDWEVADDAKNIKALRPFRDTGVPVLVEPAGASLVENGRPVGLLIGRYWYRMNLVSRSSEKGPTRSWIEWTLAGARLQAGDEVGRSPAFNATGRLGFESSLESGRVALWTDGMPGTAFRLEPGGGPCKPDVACLTITGGDGRVTLEHGQPAAFHHPRIGQRVSVAPDDLLWIAHIPYRLSPVAGSGGRTFDFLFSDDDRDYRDYRGDRRALGDVAFHGRTDVLDAMQPVEVFDVVDQFKTGHLSDSRWNPQTEDEYQLLIDAQLLCLAYDSAGVPSLVWADASKPGCPDRLGRASPPRPPVASAVLDLHRKRAGNDILVARANEILRQGTSANPEDLPFVFEWWPVAEENGVLVKRPIAVWGVRSSTSHRTLDPVIEATAGHVMPGDRRIVLLNADGSERTLARSVAGQRRYAPLTEMLGLGPVIGVRGAVDGLDGVVPWIPVNAGLDKEKLALTIVPELQERLWTSLKQETISEGITNAPGARRVFGISAVALNAETGDVLAALNWPDALKWEDTVDRAHLEQGSWGVPRNSMNTAMVRADKVGSVFKLLAMYAMADAGLLEGLPQAPQHFCGGHGKSPAGIRVFQTQADGRVISGGNVFGDGQGGPLPVSTRGLNDGLASATGSSCNSFFAFASFMLLNGDAVPNTVWRDQCPVDDRNRRLDRKLPSIDEWILCRPASAAGVEHWLIVPAKDRLSVRAQAGLKGANGHTGYFAKALDAGFRFERRGAAEAARPREDRYEGAQPFDGWMPDIPRGEGRVFRYPSMLSPRSFFGDYTSNGEFVPGVDSGRRAFVAQSIGEDGQGSALSVAVLYSAMGQRDGQAPAPRLLKTAAPPALRPVIRSAQARARIEAALRAPLEPGGTAHRTVGSLPFQQALLGKTGTFDIAFDASARQDLSDAALRDACGVVVVQKKTWTPRPSPLLGSAACEGADLTVTAVHRYPEGAAPLGPGRPGRGGRLDEEQYSSFAAIVRPPQGGSAPVVFVLVSDLLKNRETQRPSAALIAKPLLYDIWNWLSTNPK
jgi:hypothetical protein